MIPKCYPLPSPLAWLLVAATSWAALPLLVAQEPQEAAFYAREVLPAMRPRPAIATAEALRVGGATYGSLHAAAADLFGDRSCLPVVLHAPAELRPRTRAFVEEEFQRFAASLALAPLGVDVVASPVGGALQRGDASDLAAVVRRVDRHLRRGTRGLHVVLAGGRLARTLAVWPGEAGVIVLLGWSVVEEGRGNYLQHVFGLLGGLYPLWAESGHCVPADDLDDTPHHSAPNYDCLPDHYSGCTARPELAANYMDARYCELDFTWTAQQARVLLDAYADFAGSGGCGDDGVGGDCGLRLYPNPVHRRDLGGLALVTDDEAWLAAGEVRLRVTTALREVASGIVRYNGHRRLSLAPLLSSRRLAPGHYAVTATSNAQTCALPLQVTE